jgi:phosphoribosyl-AMP cyclohydrolase
MGQTDWLDELKYDRDGLIPAIVQDVDTGEVLMMAYMNRHSLAESLRTGETHFWSRSRGKYWKKGESSGHTQDICGVFIDCDMDTLLIKVRQHGGACHVGYKSCFYRKMEEGAWKICCERVFDPEQVYDRR